MKKLLLLFIIVVGWQVTNAQMELPNATYTVIQDSLYQHLDKSKITTGVLYDRVFPWASLSTFETNGDRTDTLDFSFTKQAWTELYLASYQRENLITTEQLDNIVTQNELNNKGISIGYISYDFNSIDSNAFRNGGLVVGSDSLFYDGENKTSAYLKHHIDLPIVAGTFAEGNEASFYFDPRLAFSHGEKLVQNINISAPNGNQLNLMSGQQGSIDLDGLTNTSIILEIEINFSDGSFSISSTLIGNGNASVLVNSITTDYCYKKVDSFPSGSLLTFKGYDETVATQGFGNYRVFYHQQGGSWTNCDKKIRKPIIILDGFDPEDNRHITYYFNNEGKKKDGIWDLLSYGGNKHLGDSLRFLGYDVIVLNFPNYNTIETGELRHGGAD